MEVHIHRVIFCDSTGNISFSPGVIFVSTGLLLKPYRFISTGLHLLHPDPYVEYV